MNSTSHTYGPILSYPLGSVHLNETAPAPAIPVATQSKYVKACNTRFISPPFSLFLWFARAQSSSAATINIISASSGMVELAGRMGASLREIRMLRGPQGDIIAIVGSPGAVLRTCLHPDAERQKRACSACTRPSCSRPSHRHPLLSYSDLTIMPPVMRSLRLQCSILSSRTACPTFVYTNSTHAKAYRGAGRDAVGALRIHEGLIAAATAPAKVAR